MCSSWGHGKHEPAFTWQPQPPRMRIVTSSVDYTAQKRQPLDDGPRCTAVPRVADRLFLPAQLAVLASLTGVIA